jgi:hypothetical protein
MDLPVRMSIQMTEYVMTPCSLVAIYQHSGGTCYLFLQGRRNFYSTDVSKALPDYTASQRESSGGYT